MDKIKKKIYHRNNAGFTLIEILTGIVIISIISIAMTAALVLNTKLQRDSQDRSIATTLAQSFLEDIRNASDLAGGFDGLEVTFPVAGAAFIPVADYPGFRVMQRVAAVNPELKRAEATVSWNHGATRQGQISMVSLIARPGPALNGNIQGTVIDSTTGTGIPGATVFLTWLGAPPGPFVPNAVTDGFGRYTFLGAGLNPFQIPPGNWNVDASARSFFASNSTDPDAPAATTVSAVVSSAVTTTAPDIILTPMPLPGTITGTVRSRGGSLLGGIEIRAYNDSNRSGGGVKKTTSAGNGRYKLSDLDAGNYTVATINAYRRRWGHFFGEHLLDPPYPNTPYPHHGWSSAFIDAPGGWLSIRGVSNAFKGGTIGGVDYNTVNVTAGGVTTRDIVLDWIPHNTVTGIVYDGDNRPDGVLANATIKITWHDNTNIGTFRTDADGRYTASVPIPSFTFPNAINRWLKMTASCSGYRTGNPNIGLSTHRGTINNASVELFDIVTEPAGNGDVNFLLMPLGPTYYGDVHGYVTDRVTRSGLNGVTVSIGGKNSLTGPGPLGNGYYIIRSIRVGLQNVGGKRIDYYDYSRGNAVTVIRDDLVQFDFNMLEIGYGSINGNITNLGTGQPVQGATVEIKYYDKPPVSAPSAVLTDAFGNYTLPRVLESLSGKTHTIIVSADGLVTRSKDSIIVSKDAVTTENFSLPVDSEGF
jgi:prepilin-type N-terminal cleavage/methylation domain-containing protein